MAERSSILFVDDEPQVLEGLRNALFRERRKWDLVFASGGPAALQEIRSRSFDVVVSDMQMPEVDGLQLLSAVRDQHPATVRLMLSGHVDRSLVVRAMASVHQLLSKPCTSEKLRDVIERSLAGLRSQGDARVRELVGGLDHLPTPPDVYFDLARVMESPHSTPHDATRVVRSDPALSARLLQVVNSAYFGATQPIHSITQAIQLLGLERLRFIALSEAAFRVHTEDFETARVVAKIQRTAMRVGQLACAFIAPKFRDVAFAGGLLHDLGYVVIALRRLQDFTDVMARVELGDDPLALELEAFGVTHCEIAARLLAFWGLPPEISEVIQFHHAPGDAPADVQEIASAVHVADAICSNPSAPRLNVESLTRAGCAGFVPRWLTVARALSDESGKSQPLRV